jgi:protein gp37
VAENTKIEWTNRTLPGGAVVPGKTFNPWIGCTKVSPACANCYAERDMVRRGVVTWGPEAVGGTRVITSEDYWTGPDKWARKAAREGNRPLVFCASIADVGEEWGGPIIDSHGRLMMRHAEHNRFLPFAFQTSPTTVRADWRDVAARHTGYVPVTMDDLRRALFKVIAQTAHGLDWLLLTKRPEVLRVKWSELAAIYRAELTRCISAASTDRPAKDGLKRAADYYDRTGMIGNVWAGVTAENQECADRRLPHLAEIPTPRHFVSVEPQVGEVILTGSTPTLVRNWLDAPGNPEHPKQCRGVQWVISGGESGRDARPANQDWYRSLREQATKAGASFFFKQWGEWAPDEQVSGEVIKGRTSLPVVTLGGEQHRYGKGEAGRLLDGAEWNQIPASVL